MRNKPNHQTEITTSIWSTAQDVYFIEHVQHSLAELSIVLAKSEEEIQQRKQVLGLVRRQRQMRKFL